MMGLYFLINIFQMYLEGSSYLDYSLKLTWDEHH